MTTNTLTLVLDEPAMRPLADLLALELRGGDVIALQGDLGAGKSTLARAIIRAALADTEAEVPSPTFSLMQSYDTPRGTIAHFDFYRLNGIAEAAEIGVEEAIANGAVLIEWPERASALLPADRLDIAIGDGPSWDRRTFRLTGCGHWAPRLERLMSIRDFLERSGWGSAVARAIPGDASSRRYFRLANGAACALLMDAPRQPDGPPIRDGKPYSRIAHLAEDVRPFVAIARHLRKTGLAAPDILAADFDCGLLLVEDLGDRVFGAQLQRGASQLELWRAAVDALLVLQRVPVETVLPVADGVTHTVPDFDRGAMQIETELLLDWYVPATTGRPATDAARSGFATAWAGIFDQLLAMPRSLILRDYHSPNLIDLPGRTGARRTGIIDFQDALIGPAAYDLVSLLQDARLDVSVEIEQELLDYYLAHAAAADPTFDPVAFTLAYRALGTQRNTKILGIFARLARRDGKTRYLQHIPRIWRYLERDLHHPGLAPLRAWYERHLPDDIRQRPIAT